MKKLDFKFKNFNTFVLEENVKKNSAIAVVVKGIKDIYGYELGNFIENVEYTGVEDVKNDVKRLIAPYVEKQPTTDRVIPDDYHITLDDLLTGCVSWIFCELLIEKSKREKKEKKEAK